MGLETARDLSALRTDFAILDAPADGTPVIAYLDSAATSQRPRQVLAAMQRYFTEYNANVHRGVYQISEQATAAFEGARDSVARHINAPSRKEVIFTRGTTESINLVAHSWARRNLDPGDLVVLTTMEHHSNIVPWQMVAQERQARLAFVDIDDAGRLRLDQFQRLLEQGPKLVAFTQASNVLGTITPAADLVAQARAAGAVVLVDGAQGLPHLGADVQALGCDFYAFSGHKCLGPTGIGVLWGRRQLLESMDPFMGGGEMILEVTLESAQWNELPYKFEAGTPAIAEAVGLGAAIEYLEQVGMDRIRRHECDLLEYSFEALGEVAGLHIFGPPPAERTGVVSFSMDGIHPHDIATVVDRNRVCIRAGHHCAMPLMTRLDVPAAARASFYLYNTTEDIDRLVDSLHQARRIFA